MDISIVPVNRVFKTYQGQARIAELNKKNPVKRIQGQQDKVSISTAARDALVSHANGQSQDMKNGQAKQGDEVVRAEINEDDAVLASAG